MFAEYLFTLPQQSHCQFITFSCHFWNVNKPFSDRFQKLITCSAFKQFPAYSIKPNSSLSIGKLCLVVIDEIKLI